MNDSPGPLPLRILMVGSDPSVRGGITSVITQIRSHDWRAEGICIDFIPTYLEADRFRQAAFYGSSLRNIHTCLRCNPPDLVHIHMSYKGSYFRKNNVRRQCNAASVPYVLHLHGSQFDTWYESSDRHLRSDIRRMLRDAAAVIVMGERWAKVVRGIEPGARVMILCNAVPLPKLPKCGFVGDDRSADRARSRRRFQVLYLGVLLPRKGVHDLLEAARILRDEGRIGNIHFVIAGAGAEEGRLRALTAEYELQETVTFTGWADAGKKEELFRESKALVLPSYQEGLPMAVLEALSYGLPVIASDTGDTSMAVRDTQTGYLVPPGNVRLFADRIAALAADSAAYDRMSRNARRLAEEEFSVERMYKELEACWRGAVESSRKSGGSI